jgi:hypothetical protein
VRYDAAMRRLLALVVLGLAIGAGAALVYRLGRPSALPDSPAVALRIREAARLETLDVRLYRKIRFAPEPTEAGSLWGDLAGWARHTFRAPEGRAIVFAEAHLGLDLAKVDASRVQVAGRELFVVLPEIRSTIELLPGETEIIGSNLDSADTARLLERAREAFAQDVARDAALHARARRSAETAIRALLLTAGFEAVHFVEALPGTPPA